MSNRRAPRSFGARSMGQALVEVALIMPILLLLVAGAIDLGRVWFSQITINNAAREGAMEASVNPTSWIAGQGCDVATNRVMCRTLNEAASSFVTIAPADVAMTCSPSCTPGSAGSPHTVRVSVAGHFSLITPLMGAFTGGQGITLEAVAVANITMPPSGGTLATPTPSPSPSPTPFASSSTSPSPSPTATPIPVCSAPVGSFTVTPKSGVKDSTVFQFTDTSTNMSNAACRPVWSWNFGDGSGASSQSGVQNPQYTYSKKGDYTVTLSVSNSAGTGAPKTLIISVTNN